VFVEGGEGGEGERERGREREGGREAEGEREAQVGCSPLVSLDPPDPSPPPVRPGGGGDLGADENNAE
jgi:hypothetical protein